MKHRGWHAYKLHPPGNYDFDLKAYGACREAVGPDFKLMADPVAAYQHEQALRMGRELERLNYYWLEESLFDVDFQPSAAPDGWPHYFRNTTLAWWEASGLARKLSGAGKKQAGPMRLQR